MKIAYTRAMVNAALDGKLNDAEYITDPVFGMAVPTSCPDGPAEVLIPRNTWSNGAAYAGVGSRWPVDVHAAAQALLTAVAFTGRDDRARDRAARVLGWWRRFGMRADGLPRYQVGRNFNNNSVHLRWGVGWLTLALARYGIAFG